MPYAKIKTKQATLTLEQLHAELAGKILDNRKEANRLRAAMRHVEAVLKLLVPGYDVRPIAVRRRRPNPWFKRGTVLRRVLGILKDAKGPMTAREIVGAMLTGHGVESPDPREVRNLTTTVQTCLHKNSGRTVRNVAQGMPGRWIVSP